MLRADLGKPTGEPVLAFWWRCRKCNTYVCHPKTGLTAPCCLMCGPVVVSRTLILVSMEIWTWLGFWRRRVEEAW